MGRAAASLVLLASLACATGDQSDHWAVIAVGSKGFWNYRHQADGCHAYHVLRNSGVPADQIILMMQDDVANSSQNPFRGQLFNHPGDNPPDVYDGCKVDYSGDIVTAKLFTDVITGNSAGVPKGGKVLKSGPSDRVFLNFVDHGGVGIVAFPNGPLLHASELSSALQTMQKKEMFKELVFYMEACESGSMFPDLTSDGKIFAVTATNAKVSSWGYYCSPNDKVNGRSMGTCLGDLFSIAWMEDSDLGQLSTETVAEQVKRVTKRTTKSPVQTFGDRSFIGETIDNFQSERPLPSSNGFAVTVRDVPLRLAESRLASAVSQDEKAAAAKNLQQVVNNRNADRQVFENMALQVCAGQASDCADKLQTLQLPLQNMACHLALTSSVHKNCPRREENHAGGWNGFNMQFSQTLVNMCEMADELKTSGQTLEQKVTAECQKASADVSGKFAVVV